MSLPDSARPLSFGARAYLVTAAFHFGLIGLTILLVPRMYSNAAFVPIVQNTALALWGIAYLATGILCALAAIFKWPAFARAGLVAAFAVLAVSAFAVAWGVVATWFDPDPAMSSPVIPLSFAALAVKDLLVARLPMRSREEHLRQAHEELRSS